MKIAYFILSMLLVYHPTCSLAKTVDTIPKFPALVFDVNGDPNLPKHFRSSKTAFPNDVTNPPSRQGLDNLNASGSEQFTGANLMRLLKEINQETGYIVDLRKESHGFLDNTPVSWYNFHNWENRDRNPTDVKALEQNQLHALGIIRKATVYQKNKEDNETSFNSKNISFREAKTEQRKIAESTDFDYVRFYVLDHYPPDNSQLDAFIAFTKKIPEGTWLHFHCHAGKGRTTTFLALYDMLRNAKQVSFDDILRRQALIGGADLRQVDQELPYQTPLNQQRLTLLQNFYEYAKDKNGYPKRSYSEWLRHKEKSKKGIFSVFKWE